MTGGVAASGCMSRPDRLWNHNTHYYPLVLAAVPPGCQRVLDVGCGEGMLARRLVHRGRQVVGIDQDAASIEAARRQGPVWAARPALGCGRGYRQPRPPGCQGLLAASVTDRVASGAHLPPDPRSGRGNAAGCEIPPAPVVAVLAGLGQASGVGAAEAARPRRSATPGPTPGGRRDRRAPPARWAA